MHHTHLAMMLVVTGCASTGPPGGPGERGPVSCPATCQTTYSQCTSGCIGTGSDTAGDCGMTCDRILEECMRGCEKPPEGD